MPAERPLTPALKLAVRLMIPSLLVVVVVTGLLLAEARDALAGQATPEAFDHLLRRGVLFAVLGILLGYALTVVVARLHVDRAFELRDAALLAIRTGHFAMPPGIAGDEGLGAVGDAVGLLAKRLVHLTDALRQASDALTKASGELAESALRQTDTLSRQAAALQETQTTAQEIRQTATLAAQKAESILTVADRGDDVARAGEEALAQSLGGLTDIRGQVEALSRQILELSGRTLQIETITSTVKDLANQSNMLALNAAIEASRSGEHGKGFAVVAREMRQLADQSLSATRKVREILEDVTERVLKAASATDAGARRMEAGLDQVRESGERLRELSTIVRDSSAAARQIAAAVSQQSAGIGEIFAAVTEQSRMMDETLERVGQTSDAAKALELVARRVASLAGEGARGDDLLRPLPTAA